MKCEVCNGKGAWFDGPFLSNVAHCAACESQGVVKPYTRSEAMSRLLMALDENVVGPWTPDKAKEHWLNAVIDAAIQENK